MPTPDPDVTYEILTQWAFTKAVKTYKELSQAYHEQTGDWHEPYGSWNGPLGAINNRVWKGIEGPAISALVIKNETKEPGGDFWGCAPNVPQRPNNDVERVAVWSQIVNDVLAFNWPKRLP